MMPRSSRSHSTQVPADSMIASMPQVIVPPRRQAMIGMVPAGPRTAWVGRVGAQALVEHAAGAEGGLGLPGRGAALADERGLLVAGHAGDGRRARRARVAVPSDARRVDDRRAATASGIRERGEQGVAPAATVAVDQARSPRRWRRR